MLPRNREGLDQTLGWSNFSGRKRISGLVFMENTPPYFEPDLKNLAQDLITHDQIPWEVFRPLTKHNVTSLKLKGSKTPPPESPSPQKTLTKLIPNIAHHNQILPRSQLTLPMLPFKLFTKWNLQTIHADYSTLWVELSRIEPRETSQQRLKITTNTWIRSKPLRNRNNRQRIPTTQKFENLQHIPPPIPS